MASFELSPEDKAAFEAIVAEVPGCQHWRSAPIPSGDGGVTAWCFDCASEIGEATHVAWPVDANAPDPDVSHKRRAGE